MNGDPRTLAAGHALGAFAIGGGGTAVGADVQIEGMAELILLLVE